jgi:hypothetical protein
MARIHTTVFLALATVSSLFAQQSPDPDSPLATVEGTILNAENNRTIPRATVTLRGLKGAGSKSVRADGVGHFLFSGVEPGTYMLVAERQGFFSDERKREYQPVIQLAAGQYLKNLPVRLMPTAVISGEIMDEYNDPVQNVEVRLLAQRMRLGQMYLAIAGKAVTDDRGQYRIPDLRPGKYYVIAESLNKSIKDSVANTVTEVISPPGPVRRGEQQPAVATPQLPDPPFTYAPLFFPGTGDFQQAQPLALKPGDDVPANFIFVTAPVVSISGRVTDGMTGAPAPSAAVAAFWSPYLQGDGIPARISPQDGTFEIKGLAPGIYTLRASFTADNQNFAAEQTLEVGAHGAQNVQLAALPDFLASGHVTIAGNPRPQMGRVLIEFVGEGLMPRVRANATLPEFKFDAQLRPEKRYYANVRNLPDDYYLKSITISGHEVPADDVVVSGTRGDLELVLSPAGGHIEGVLFDSQDQPARGTVLLIPDATDPGPPETFRRARADSTGKFSLRGLPPGPYRVLALESANVETEINSPEFLRSLGNRGQHLLVEENGKYSVVLKLEPE